MSKAHTSPETADQRRHREALAREHLRIQASLVRCRDCQFYFRDIDNHAATSVTVTNEKCPVCGEIAGIHVDSCPHNGMVYSA
jgi:rubrerythrin